MSYTDTSLIASFLKRELTDNERLTLAVLVPAIQKWIDNKLGTTFLKAVPSTRVFDGGEGSIDIDPCTAVTAVTSLDNYGVVSYTYTTDQYLLEPVNATVKNELRHRYGCWPHGDSRIAVTAIFSEWDNGVPEDIRAAATKIAADVLVFSAGADNVASESLEGHSITYDTSSNAISTIANNDPFVNSVLELHRSLMVG